MQSDSIEHLFRTVHTVLDLVAVHTLKYFSVNVNHNPEVDVVSAEAGSSVYILSSLVSTPRLTPRLNVRPL